MPELNYYDLVKHLRGLGQKAQEAGDPVVGKFLKAIARAIELSIVEKE